MNDFHETPPVEKRCSTCRHARSAHKYTKKNIGWLEMLGFHPKNEPPIPPVAGKLICWHPDVAAPENINALCVVLDMAVCSEWEPKASTDA